MIAAAETGDFAEGHLTGVRGGKPLLKLGAQLAGAVQVARHVGADSHVGAQRLGQLKMGIETGDAVDLVKGRLSALGKGLQLCRGQIAAAELDGPQIVEDHSPRLARRSAGSLRGVLSGAKRIAESSEYYWRGAAVSRTGFPLGAAMRKKATCRVDFPPERSYKQLESAG